MTSINVSVDSLRRASAPCGAEIVADNNDQVLVFEIAADSGFDTTSAITAVFVTDGRGKLPSVDFVGNSVTAPRLTDEDGITLYVGITQGSIKTTTYAVIRIIPSVYAMAGGRVAPDPYEPTAYDELPAADEAALNDLVVLYDVSAGKREKATLQILKKVIADSSAGTVYVTTDSPFADIQAALEADKAVILRIEEENGAIYYPCTYYSTSENDMYAVFARDSEDEWSKMAYYCTLSEGVTTWTDEFMDDDFVSVHPQSYTDNAKAQARTNIDAQKAEAGKGLSTNDYTNAAKAKVDAIPPDPKYTDTVYDDTGLSNRVTVIEGKESGWNGKAEATEKVVITDSGAVSQALVANKTYWFTGTLTALTLTLTAYTGDVDMIYCVKYVAGAAAPSITLPNDVAESASFADEIAKTDTVVEINIGKIPPITVGGQTYNYLALAVSAEVSAT